MQGQGALGALTVRMEWLEDMRTFTWNAASDETRAEWQRLRAHPRPGGRSRPEDGAHPVARRAEELESRHAFAGEVVKAGSGERR